MLRSAARLCLQLLSFASVSNAMRRDLHWLNFPNRVTYKLCLMAYMCQHEMARVYFRRYCVPTMTIMGRAQLRSTRVLSVPRTRTVKFSRSGFYFAGPSAWNSLPVRLRQLPTFQAFKKGLKTYLFDLWICVSFSTISQFILHTYYKKLSLKASGKLWQCNNALTYVI